MEWNKPTEEEKLARTNAKEKKLLEFKNLLDNNRINYLNPSKYHFQIQRIHNFYPSTNKYYNSDSGDSFYFTMFENVDELYRFLSKNTK